MKKGLIIGIIVLVLAGAGAYALTRNQDETASPTESTANTGNNSDSADSTAADTPTSNNQTAAITYTDDGFSPATLTVKAGTTVTVKNNSSNDMQFASDPHPAHTDNEEINAGVIEPGKSQTFTAERTGTYGYHNHLNETETGTLIVQ